MGDATDSKEKKDNKAGKKKVPLVVRYAYHANAQVPPTGEMAFHQMTIPFAWAVNPLCDRLPLLHERIPVTFLYGNVR